MKYMGSKSRIKKFIVPIIQEEIIRNNIKTYIEPFCGGCNVIDDIVCENKIARDLSLPLIELLKYIQNDGELPTEVPKDLYDDVRNNKNNNKYPSWYTGAIGFLASYNGRYFDGGYAKTIVSKTGKVRNYYNEAKRNLENQRDKLKGIVFEQGSYEELDIDIGSTLIYCDIPYKNTKQYSTSKNFNHDNFWSWVREMSKNNIVIVSEEEAPEDFTCIWEQEVTRTQDNRKRDTATEKLFVYNSLTY